MHIELTEMLRCPESHQEEFLVLATGEMSGRMVLRGVVGCPVCHRQYEIIEGIVDFTEVLRGGPGQRAMRRTPAQPTPAPVDAVSLQGLLDLSGPGGYVVLLGSAARHAVSLAGLMGGIHFVGVNAPEDVTELPVLSLLQADRVLPLRGGFARGVVVGAECVEPHWLDEAARVLLRGRRLVVEREHVEPPGVRRLAVGQGLWVGEKG
jgi:uncharacterized protein YbaR (Trm112 family)